MEEDFVNCPLCHLNIISKCYPIHSRACQKKHAKGTSKKIAIESENMIPCSECGENVPFEIYAMHLEQCEGRQLVKCQQCKLLYPTFLIEEHRNVCETFNEEPEPIVAPTVKPAKKGNYFEGDFEYQVEQSEEDEELDEEHDEEMNEMISQLAKKAPLSEDPLTAIQVASIRQKVSSKADDCSICYMKVFPKSMILQLPCPHIYHIRCISVWLQKNPLCPMCRTHALTKH